MGFFDDLCKTYILKFFTNFHIQENPFLQCRGNKSWILSSYLTPASASQKNNVQGISI